MCVCETNLSHLSQIQRGPLLLGVLGPPALHPDLLIDHTGLGAAAGQVALPLGSLCSSPPQLWSGVWRAGLRSLLLVKFGEADLLMGQGEGPQEVLLAGVLVVLCWGRGGGHWGGSELVVERQALSEQGQVQWSV